MTSSSEQKFALGAFISLTPSVAGSIGAGIVPLPSAFGPATIPCQVFIKSTLDLFSPGFGHDNTVTPRAA